MFRALHLPGSYTTTSCQNLFQVKGFKHLSVVIHSSVETWRPGSALFGRELLVSSSLKSSRACIADGRASKTAGNNETCCGSGLTVIAMSSADDPMEVDLSSQVSIGHADTHAKGTGLTAAVQYTDSSCTAARVIIASSEHVVPTFIYVEQRKGCMNGTRTTPLRCGANNCYT